MDGRSYGRENKLTDGWTDMKTDRQTEIQMDRRATGPTDRQKQMDRQMKIQME